MATVTTTIQRVIIPIIFTTCTVCRPAALSIPYLLFVFFIPFVPLANGKSIRGRTGYFYKIVFATSLIITLLQIVFQVVLLVYGDDFLNSGDLLKIVSTIGLIDLNKADVESISLWFLPDIVMLATSFFTYIILKNVTKVSNNDAEEGDAKQTFEDAKEKKNDEVSLKTYVLTRKAAIFCAMVTLLLAAVLRPSIPSAIYFAVFLWTATVWAWASYKIIDRGFAVICRALCVMLALHINALIVYQTPLLQEVVSANSTIIRYLGFSQLINSTCISTRVIRLNNNIDLDELLNPFALLLCYYTLAITSGFILSAKSMTDWVSLQVDRSKIHLNNNKRVSYKRGDSVFSDIPLENIGAEDNESESGKELKPPNDSKNNHFSIRYSIFKQSYVLSSIMMMIWSVVYHSWLASVFLIVTILLWIIPNQRKNMHRISSFVVSYATFLLIAQYVYGMNLTEDELPSTVYKNGINLGQIGFIRYTTYPCVPLLLKTLFTITFWLTMRQSKYEASKWKSASLFASLQVTVNVGTIVFGAEAEIEKSKILMRAGTVFKSVLIQSWIWIVAFALFTCAIYGQEITIFQIIYMGLFLMFMIAFQLSWLVWKKMMYTLWIVVIGVSMLKIITVYTYQFDEIEKYWAEYMGIDKDLQIAIGLVKYEMNLLFLHLLYPTLLVMLTVVQLQIFHKKYLDRFDFTLLVERDNSESRLQPTSGINYNETESTASAHEKANTLLENVLARLFLSYDKSKWGFDVLLLFLELHMIKIVLMVGFLLCVNEVSAVHIILVLLTICAVSTKTNTQIIYGGIIALIVGLFLMLKMIYQIQKISAIGFHGYCNITHNGTVSVNSTDELNVLNQNAVGWFGLNKLLEGQSPMQFLHGYLLYIIILAKYNTILMYQQRKRILNGTKARPKVLFDHITRNDADKDLVHLFKYISNFAFYKFGVEITLVMLVILIGARMDVVAAIYTTWLCIMCAASRDVKRLIWPIFQWFNVVFIIIQYVIVVDLPPFLCLDISWKAELLNVRAFISVHYPTLLNQPHKIVFDFILLMATCRQVLVFRIEKQDPEFMGGSNKSEVEKIKKMSSGDVLIQTHDFVTFTRNWLDVIKCAVFFGFFWITLAVVLLAGTNNIDIFSFGYLIGSFIFLYQGTNFYMRPIDTILRRWKYLIAYNIFVITTKTLFKSLFDGFFELNNQKLSKLLGVMSENNGLEWDCLCFAFLIFQLRIFQSYYFCHIINETRGTSDLDSRGAKLIDDRRRTQFKMHAQREEEMLQKIKRKMELIKSYQKSLQPTLTPPKTHYDAVRSNCNYLLEDVDAQKELDLMLKPPSDGSIDAFSAKKLVDKITLKQVLSNKLHDECNEHQHVRTRNNQYPNPSYIVKDEESVQPNHHGKRQTHKIVSLLIAFMTATLVSMTIKLYKSSRNYRYVNDVLSKEKKAKKLRTQSINDNFSDEVDDFYSQKHSILTEFFQSLWFALISNTEIICYLLVFINVVVSQSILILPMALMVFLWSTLTTPRSSKKFWFTLIVYAQILVFIKFVFLLIPQLDKSLITKSSATIILVLLFAILFHRSVQKQMGIWTNDSRYDDTIYTKYLLNLSLINPWKKIETNCSSAYRGSVDVYTYMFLCDFVNFLVLLFGFSAFGWISDSENVHTYLSENNIPITFLMALLLQFVLIIVDRMLYLRQNLTGKIIFHCVSIVCMHVWLLIPTLRGHSFNMQWAPIVYYIVKSLYFLLSAYQIRCGYPSRISGNFLTKGFTMFHWRAFEVFQWIPFLFESRVLMDWFGTKSSLSLFEYFKMEDMFAKIFVLKCCRQFEEDFPTPRGKVKGSKWDIIRGCASLIAIVLLAWGPLSLFAFENSVGRPNVPYEVRVLLQIGPYEPLYTMKAHSSRIHQFTEQNYADFSYAYKDDRVATEFLSKYTNIDVAAVVLGSNSTSLWTISPPHLEQLKADLISNETLTVFYEYFISRDTHNEKMSRTVSRSQSFDLLDKTPVRKELIAMLDQVSDAKPTQLPFLFPTFLKVMNAKGLKPITQLIETKARADKQPYRNLSLALHQSDDSKWWQVLEECGDEFFIQTLSKLPYYDCEQSTVLYTFNDEIFPPTLGFIIGTGVIGLYSTFLLLASNFFRGLFTGGSLKVMFKELPYVDRILQLCLDIYLVREQHDLLLEEDLFARLVFLYRSPETMIQWTRRVDNESDADDASDIDETDAEKALRKTTKH